MSTFSDLIAYFAPADQPLEEFDLEPILGVDESSEGLIQEALIRFIAPMVRKKQNLQRRTIIDIKATACPDLVNVCAQNADGSNKTFRMTRFHSDLVRLGQGAPSPAYGLRFPDTCVYAQCILPLPTPAIQAPPDPASKSASTSDSTSESVTTDLNAQGQHALSCLLTTQEATGTYMGLIIHGTSYTIMLAINDSLCLFYDSSGDPQGVGDQISIDDYLTRHKTFPDTYGKKNDIGEVTLEENAADLRRIWRIYWDSTSLLLGLRSDEPLQRLSLPHGRLFDLFSTVAHIALLDSDAARRWIAMIVRPELEAYFAVEEDTGEDAGGGGGRGPGRGTGGARGARGVRGGVGGEASGNSRSGRRRGHQFALAQENSTANEAAERLSRLAAHSRSSLSDPGLTSSTSSGCSGNNPIPPHAPEDHAGIPLSASGARNRSEKPSDKSGLPPLDKPAVLSSSYVFHDDDFPDIRWEDFPLDQEIEEDDPDGVQAERDTAMRFLAQRAHLRSKGRFLMPVGHHIFEALLSEIHAHAAALNMPH
ncbi:hypothetical protein I317_01740 [Kwoniella heveanensis CBS 569]|nr:hypothetical protein I317_01740 [Kwoniella heveanensis CBS 569]